MDKELQKTSGLSNSELVDKLKFRIRRKKIGIVSSTNNIAHCRLHEPVNGTCRKTNCKYFY